MIVYNVKLSAVYSQDEEHPVEYMHNIAARNGDGAVAAAKKLVPKTCRWKDESDGIRHCDKLTSVTVEGLSVVCTLD